jgi:plastocyanin
MSARLIVVCLSALAAVSCGSSSNSSPTSPSTSSTTVAIVQGAQALTTTAYSPNPVTVARGTTLTWVNNDTTAHDQIADGGAFNTGNVNPGGRASVTLQNAGTVTYHCGIHPNMVGTINVQ